MNLFVTSLLMTFINILIVAIWKSRQAFRSYGRGNMPLQAVKLQISHNNVVGENTVLQLNILETGIRTLVVQNSSRWRWILNHSCENMHVSQNVLKMIFMQQYYYMFITTRYLSNINISKTPQHNEILYSYFISVYFGQHAIRQKWVIGRIL